MADFEIHHDFVSPVEDAQQADIVGPDEWNAKLVYSGVLPIANGGTGEITANAAFNALAPSQTGNSGSILTTNGANTSWDNAAGIFTAGDGIDITVNTISADINTTNLQFTANKINTIQDIHVTATPTFGQLTLSDGLLTIGQSAGTELSTIRMRNSADSAYFNAINVEAALSDVVQFGAPTGGAFTWAVGAGSTLLSIDTSVGFKVSSGIDVEFSSTTASRMLATDSNKHLVSSDITSFIAGTAPLDVADDGDGTATLSIDSDLANLRKFFYGTFAESFNALVTSDGATVTMSLEQSGGGDLTMQLSSGNAVLDTTPAATVTLTAGSDASPTTNYVYILQSTLALTLSTSGWPSVEHIKVAFFLVPSAAFVQTNGVYVNQNWNDHLDGTDSQGHMSHIAERSRLLGAKYNSGVAGNGTDGYLTPTASNVELKYIAGVVYQMHKHTVPAFDTSTGDTVLVKNWSGDAYHNITNLFDIIADSTGALIGNNKYFNLVLWAVANKTGEFVPTVINLPAGFYNSQPTAAADASGFDDFTIPDEFSSESSTGFLVARITIRMGTTWEVVSTVDLRKSALLTASGGASSSQIEFPDNTFKIFDESDVTKIVQFQVSGVSTGATRTLTVPDNDGTIITTGNLTDITALGTITNNVDFDANVTFNQDLIIDTQSPYSGAFILKNEGTTVGDLLITASQITWGSRIGVSMRFLSASTDDMIFGTNSTAAMTIDGTTQSVDIAVGDLNVGAAESTLSVNIFGSNSLLNLTAPTNQAPYITFSRTGETLANVGNQAGTTTKDWDIVNRTATGSVNIMTAGFNKRVTVLNTGLVGVNTSVPSTNLTVLGSSTAFNQHGTLLVKTDNPGTGGAPRLAFGIKNGANAMEYAYIQSIESGVAVRPLLLQDVGAGVGIGILVSPLSRLDINGNLAVGNSYAGVTAAPSNGMIVEGSVYIGSTSGTGAVQVSTTNGTATGVFFLEDNSVAGSSGTHIQWNDANRGVYARIGRDTTVDVTDFHEFGAFRWYTGGAIASQSLAMIINSAGSVGIGQSTANQKLQVQGHVRLDSTTATGRDIEWSLSESVKFKARLNSNIQWELYDNGSAKSVMVSELFSDKIYFPNGKIGFGTTAPTAKVHIDQSSGTGAIPVLYLDQADISEPIMQIECAIGTGNGLEAIGAKTFTTTHFEKVEITGGLIRYRPLGTIA